MRRRLWSTAVPVHRHSLGQIVVDGGLVALAYYLAFQLRFDQGMPDRYARLMTDTLAPVVVGSLALFTLFRLYQRWWRFSSQRDYETAVRAVVVATLALVGYISLAQPTKIVLGGKSVAVGLPSGVLALYFLLLLCFLIGSRFLVHYFFERSLRGWRSAKNSRSVLIIGAGDGGQLVLREIVRNPDLAYRPVGFADDDPRKRGLRVANGLKVLGPTTELDRILEETQPDEVIIAIPSAPGTLRARVVSSCRDRGIPVRTLPTVFELLQGKANVMRQVREVQVEDVLGREPIVMELSEVGAYLQEEIVLVTGAGGSIGRELCRQIAHVGPRQLILVDHAEDNLFEILRELEQDRHYKDAVAVLADCKQEPRMREVFTRFRPTAVFHAAAYKHVGLMELNPVEAVRNNALATKLVANIAGEFGARSFVLVSTDKAVAPSTAMGASKALAEWAVEAAGYRYPDTHYMVVRFGNVLGSSNSVVPIFRRQIASGGPVTVTDREMTRYFMTIPEAVQLIIRAGALGEGGEIFVLEMGDPVKIIDLADAMIRLCGLEPERDIAIEIVGAQPGEKLHEQLFDVHEQSLPTKVDKILLAQREPLDPSWLEETFDRIELLVLEDDVAGLAAKVAELSRERMALAQLKDQTTADI